MHSNSSERPAYISAYSRMYGCAVLQPYIKSCACKGVGAARPKECIFQVNVAAGPCDAQQFMQANSCTPKCLLALRIRHVEDDVQEHQAPKLVLKAM